MEDPEREIREVVRLVTAASTPEEQRDAVSKYVPFVYTERQEDFMPRHAGTMHPTRAFATRYVP